MRAGSPPIEPTRRQAAVALSALVLGAAAVYVLGIRWGVFQSEPTWAFDEILPSQVRGQWPVLYPPAHLCLLRPVYAAVDALGLSRFPAQGGLGPVVAPLLAARALGLLMACATLVLVYRIGRRVSSRGASLFTVACVAFGTNYVYYAKTANLDIPYVFWFAAALLFFYKGLERARLRDLVLFATCAAIATATKDQAGGLFLLPPLALLWARRRQLGAPLWRAAIDPALLLAAAVGAATYLLIFGEPWSGELSRHLDALRSLPYEHYRTYELSAAGLPRLAGQSLRNLAFVSGLPVLVAAAVGLAIAARRPGREARLLSSLLFALPYWALFIAASGFNYDRHYLPLTVVLALFAARAFDAAGSLRRRPLWLAAFTATVLLFLAGRALSVSLMLRGDARYAAQQWMQADGLLERTIGLGKPQLLPAGIPRYDMNWFEPRRIGEHGYNADVWHNCRVLEWLAAEYLVIERPELFATPGLNYRPSRRFRNSAPFDLVGLDRFPFYYSNIVKPARDVVIFRRTDDACVDLDPLAVALHELRRTPDRARSDRLARSIFDSPDVYARSLGLGDVRLVRTRGLTTTSGSLPAGVAVRNRGFAPRRVEMWIAVEGVDRFPVAVSVADGETTRRVVFDRAGVKKILLAPVAAGGHRLFIVHTDRTWRDASGEVRGARLLFLPAADEKRRRKSELDRDLRRIAGGEATGLRRSLADAIAAKRLDHPIREIEGALAVGVNEKGWTMGSRPVALLVENDRSRPREAVLHLTARAVPGAQTPIAAIEDGDTTTRHEIRRDEVTRVSLGPVAARSRRLFIVQTVGATAGDPAALSLRLRSVGSRPLSEKGTELATDDATGH